MKSVLLRVMPLALMAASSLTFASMHLTPMECNSYPFKAANGSPTTADVHRELAELESFGYRPALDNYSPDIGEARNRLNAEYAKDCMPPRTTASTHSSTNG